MIIVNQCRENVSPSHLLATPMNAMLEDDSVLHVFHVPDARCAVTRSRRQKVLEIGHKVQVNSTVTDSTMMVTELGNPVFFLTCFGFHAHMNTSDS